MPCQQYFRYIKVTYHRIVLPVRSAGARENVPCLIAFLTMVITIATGINPAAPGWNILERFQNKNINAEMVCSRTVSEQTFLWNSSRKILTGCSRTVLEQTIIIIMK